MKAFYLIFGLLIVLAMGCGEATPETQAENSEDAAVVADDQQEVEETTPEEVVEERADNEIMISGTNRDEYSPALDGLMEIGSAFAEDRLSSGVTFLIATYEVEEDPQFGWSVPVGVPEVPEDGLILTCRIVAPEGLQVGEYTSEDSEVGRIGNISLYHSSGRINPLGRTTVVITEIAEEYILGEISGVGETEFQQFPTLNGHFKLAIL
ncbi:MAG: hypothetical protein U9P42_03240 [Candidatus Fermentibacteria bacterium]|nr:hypothetical protein [Candidatus Fermentibacteria bacterium]